MKTLLVFFLALFCAASWAADAVVTNAAYNPLNAFAAQTGVWPVNQTNGTAVNLTLSGGNYTNSATLPKVAAPLGTGIADGVFFTCPNARGIIQGTLEITNTTASSTICAISNVTTGSFYLFGGVLGGSTNFVSFSFEVGPQEVIVLTNLSGSSLAGTPFIVTNEWR